MSNVVRGILVLLVIAGGAVFFYGSGYRVPVFDEKKAVEQQDLVGYYSIEELVYDHAAAWETGDLELLKETIHDDIIFAYPGRRLNYDELIEDFIYYRENFSNTRVYITSIIIGDEYAIDGTEVAVEWQFAYTDNATGKRIAVSDGIIGEVLDGKIVLWKEYLDGRVSRMQQVDALPLEEGEEPFPSPLGSLRNFCEVTAQ